MSILPLSGPLGVALTSFSLPITAQDTTYTATNGEDVQALSGAAYTISGAIEINRNQVEYLFGGSASSGSITVTTTAELYIDDVYAPSATRKQSFITHAGTIYRVSQCLDWMQQAGVRVYLAERHVRQQVE